MKTTLCAGMILLAGVAVAQKPRLTSGTSGAGIDNPYARLWNETWVLNFGGRITGINVGPPAKNETGNTVQIIVLSPNGGSSFVELGPQWYVESQPTKLHLGDKVQVTGSKIMRDHRGSILAGKIVVDGKDTLNLRDVHGAPLWRITAKLVAQKKPQAPDPKFTEDKGVTRIVRVKGGEFGSTMQIEMKSVTVDGLVHHFNIDKGNVTMFMQVEGEMRKIYLGPEWFIARQHVRLMPGDQITATILAPNNFGALAYAETIVTRDGTLRFRNDSGEISYSP